MPPRAPTMINAEKREDQPPSSKPPGPLSFHGCSVSLACPSLPPFSSACPSHISCVSQHTNFPPNIDRQTCGSMPRARTLETHAGRGHDTTSISSIGPASTASADTRRPASAASEQQIRTRSQIQENDADNCRIGGCGKLFHMVSGSMETEHIATERLRQVRTRF